MVTSPKNDIETIETVRSEVAEAAPTIRERLEVVKEALPADDPRDGALDAGILVELRDHDAHEGGRAGQFSQYARDIEQAGGSFDELYTHLDEADTVMSKLSDAMAALTEAANALQTLQHNAEWAQNNPTNGNHRTMNTILDALDTADEKLEAAVEALDDLQRAIPDKETLKEAFQAAQAAEYRREDEFDF